jgi:protoporphyrinogen oxidase
VPPEEYGGRHILYVVNYHAQSSPLFKMGGSQLLKHHGPSLARVYGERFRANDVVAAYAFHALDSSPVYDLDYHARIPGYEPAWRNVHICGMEQVYPHDRNMNRCVVNAGRFLASRQWRQG